MKKKSNDEVDNRTAAVRIIEVLRQNNHQAYLVGGCVRDMLLGKEEIPEHDVACSAWKEEICRLFRRTRKVGAKFGVVLVGVGGQWIEVAGFRTDESYSDGRRPDSVKPSTIEEDAQRRDFTVNGLFYDPIDDKLIDLVGGRSDIANRIIRAIGEPELRFREDYLRMLRAVRFAAQLSEFDFSIEENTARAISHNAGNISGISSERILGELKKILRSPGRRVGIKLLYEFGILRHILPELTDSQIFERTMRVVANLPDHASFELAMAGLLHLAGTREGESVESHSPVRLKLIGKDMNATAILSKKITRRLKCSNIERAKISWLIEFLPRFSHAETLRLSDIKRMIIYQRFDELMTLFRARVESGFESKEALLRIEKLSSEIRSKSIVSEPLINGEDLMVMLNLKPGPGFRKILDEVYDAQLNGEISTKSQALKLAENLNR